MSLLEKQIIESGLNEKEAKVYLASLSLGQATVQDIAKESGVNRATTYVAIEHLTSLGLISSFYQGKKQFFIAADPEKLIEVLDKEKEKIEEKKEKLKKIIPELQSMNNKIKDKPVVKYYEGKEGIKTMVDEVIKTNNREVYMAYSVDMVADIFSNEEKEKWRKERVKNNIKVRSIYTSKNQDLKNIPNSKNTKVPFNKFPISCDIAVYGNKVRIASLKDRLVGIIIEDEEIAKTIEAILKLGLEAAAKYNKEK